MLVEGSKRISRFKSDLIKSLPFFPNNRETKEALESLSLNALLFHYLHWSLRKVPPRPRKTIISPEVTADPRWKKLSNNIQALVEKARTGVDLSPHLSMKAHKRGYTLHQCVIDGKIDKWQDKDFLLNTKGFHHFHLDMNIENNGFAKRTDDVLFAFISRKTFHAVGIFDHSVFDSPVQNSGKTNSEWIRMWALHKKHAACGMEPNTVYVTNPISTSGHPLKLHRIIDQYSQSIYQIDPKLDDRIFLAELYEECKLQPPKNPKLYWSLCLMDLGIYDQSNDMFIKINNWVT